MTNHDFPTQQVLSWQRYWPSDSLENSEDLHKFDATVDDDPEYAIDYYSEMEMRDRNTFEGIYIPDEEKAALFLVLYGPRDPKREGGKSWQGGLYQHRRQLRNAAKNPVAHNPEQIAWISDVSIPDQLKAIEVVLRPLIEEAGISTIPEQNKKIDEVVDAIEEKFKGEENKEKRHDELKRLHDIRIRYGIGKSSVHSRPTS